MVMLQNLAFPFFVIAVPNKWYYIKMANINVKNKVYVEVL